MNIITKGQWTANNSYFKKHGVTLWEKSIANAMYNYNQVLNGNYAAFGTTNNAMNGEKSIVKGYASKVRAVASACGVKFNGEKTVKGKLLVENQPTLDEFHGMLIEAFDKKDKEDYDFGKKLESFLKTADKEGYGEEAEAIQVALAALAERQNTLKIAA